jgi:peroxiredoxin
VALSERPSAVDGTNDGGASHGDSPEWISGQIERSIQELIDSGATDLALRMGARAPAFQLVDAAGTMISSADLLARGPLVVTFYRGAWCPYCNQDLRALQAVVPQIEALGASVVAISPQLPVNSKKSVREHGLTFPILSDPGNDVAARFGLRYEMPGYLVDLYKNTFKVDLSVINGDASWTLPMPARYVIDQDDSILYAEVSPNYMRRADPAEVVPVLAQR